MTQFSGVNRWSVVGSRMGSGWIFGMASRYSPSSIHHGELEQACSSRPATWAWSSARTTVSRPPARFGNLIALLVGRLAGVASFEAQRSGKNEISKAL
jgi:hypothetical protein